MPPRLGASLQHMAEFPQPILQPAAGDFLNAIGMPPMHVSKLGKIAGKQDLSDAVLMCLVVCVLQALRSSISIAFAMHALQPDDSTWSAEFIVCMLACTMS